MRNDLHFMLDLETMATGPDAAIVSIGCVRFDLYAGAILDTFYLNITLQSNADYYRKIDPETVEWWLKQDKTAQEALFAGERTDLGAAVGIFRRWLINGHEDQLTKFGRIWSNGPTFDEVIIRHAFNESMSEEFPIPFRGSRCMRTIIEIGKAMGLPKPPRGGQHHHALDDAVYQTEGVIAVFKELKLS